MNIVILGKGNMGTPLTTLAANAGHSVQNFDSKGDPRAALAAAEIVMLAMKYEQALAFAERPGIAEALAGKIVVDVTNPLSPDFMSLTVGHSSSAAEEIAARLPGAQVVKAFNTLFAAVLAARAAGAAVKIPVFVAGDAATAVAAVVGLAQGFGLKAVETGSLATARYLEPMTELMIHLGYGLGHGDRIGFGLLQL